MELAFTKMQGAGNDFLLVDDRTRAWTLTPAQVQRLCHRQRGVGADGVLLLRPGTPSRADWAWEFFNSDGSRAEMCGNGARCFARFIQRLTDAPGPVTFETGAGVISARFHGARVTVSLTPPCDLRLNQTVVLADGPRTVHSVNTGVPHAVLLVSDLDQVPVLVLGAALRHHAQFAPRGTNVDFVQVLGPQTLRLRTYERGVEGETLACGTGVTAAALVAARVQGLPSPLQVRVQGGDLLEVGFKEVLDGWERVELTGPAEFVFEGRLRLENL